MYQAPIMVLYFLLFVATDVKFKRVKITDTMSVSVPESFFPMTEQDIASRHISYRKPLAIYINPDRTVDFSVNTAVSNWPASDLPLMKGFYKASIGALFNQVEFLTDEIRVIDDREFAVLEFISVTDAEEGAINQGAIRNYSYAQYAIIDDKTYVFTFTSPARQKEKWQPIAQNIMESIKIKKTRK